MSTIRYSIIIPHKDIPDLLDRLLRSIPNIPPTQPLIYPVLATFILYLRFYNNDRIKLKLKMSPVQYRTHFQNQVK